MKKTFLTFNEMRNDALKLAHRIQKEGFVPDIIYCAMRGGAYLANVISEYFKLVTPQEKPILFAAVVAHSYQHPQESGEVTIEGWTYPPDCIQPTDKILLVDDIFDSGKTLNRLVEVLQGKGIARQQIKIAVHDYKIYHYHQKQPAILPDFWCRKWEIHSPGQNPWIHYLSHELVGLTSEELEKHYFSEDEQLRPLFEEMRTTKDQI